MFCTNNSSRYTDDSYSKHVKDLQPRNILMTMYCEINQLHVKSRIIITMKILFTSRKKIGNEKILNRSESTFQHLRSTWQYLSADDDKVDVPNMSFLQDMVHGSTSHCCNISKMRDVYR